MKRGYIFTLDVFVAAIILIVGVILVIGLLFYAPAKERTEALSSDVIGVLANVKLKEVCDFSAGCSCDYTELDSLCSEMKNPNISLLEFLGQLYHDKVDNKDISKVIDEIFIGSGIVPGNFELQITLYDPLNDNEQQLYPESP